MRMTRAKILLLAVTTAASLGLFRASAATAETLVTFTALLNGPQQSPPVDTPSQGVALVLLVKETNTVCYRISYSPLVGAEILAHFHGPAAPGENAPILVNISPSPSPLTSPKHGCVPFTKDQVKLLTKGLLYINVHSTFQPNGEIRGQVLPTKIKYSKVTPPASPSGAFVE